MRVSDFRSDTVTRPSEAMWRAMAAAEVGDDVLDGDPTVRRLEQEAAAFLGKEGALFVPSGTMANQVALGAWTRPGDQVVCAHDAHVVRWEAGAPGALHGVLMHTLACRGGRIEPDAVRAALRPDSPHCPRTTLLCVEQTHGDSGGRVVPLELLEALGALARDAGLRVHLDGARLCNAVVASGVPAATWAAQADSVAMCFSKGLGAPVGSVVAGDAAFLAAARVVRKRLGGWMRQAGVVAAAARVALAQHVERLADDHRLARELAGRLAGLPGLSVRPEEVETNMVLVGVDPAACDGGGAPELARRLGERGVRVLALSPGTLRFVTHLDVGPQDVEHLARSAKAVLGV